MRFQLIKGCFSTCSIVESCVHIVIVASHFTKRTVLPSKGDPLSLAQISIMKISIFPPTNKSPFFGWSSLISKVWEFHILPEVALIMCLAPFKVYYYTFLSMLLLFLLCKLYYRTIFLFGSL